MFRICLIDTFDNVLNNNQDDIKRSLMFWHKNTISGLARMRGWGRVAGGKLEQNNAKEVTAISRAKGTTLAQCLFVQLNNGLISGWAQSREVFVQYSIIRLPLNKTIPRPHYTAVVIALTYKPNTSLRIPASLWSIKIITIMLF